MIAMYSLLLKLFELKNKTYLNITIFDKYFYVNKKKNSFIDLLLIYFTLFILVF